MIERVAVGELPKKHHITLRDAKGNLRWEECLTRRGFDRHFLFLSERTNVCRAEFKLNPSCEPLVMLFDQPFNKLRIGIAGSSAQSMIEMANDQSFVTEAD